MPQGYNYSSCYSRVEPLGDGGEYLDQQSLHLVMPQMFSPSQEPSFGVRHVWAAEEYVVHILRDFFRPR